MPGPLPKSYDHDMEETLMPTEIETATNSTELTHVGSPSRTSRQLRDEIRELKAKIAARSAVTTSWINGRLKEHGVALSSPTRANLMIQRDALAAELAEPQWRKPTEDELAECADEIAYAGQPMESVPERVPSARHVLRSSAAAVAPARREPADPRMGLKIQIKRLVRQVATREGLTEQDVNRDLLRSDFPPRATAMESELREVRDSLKLRLGRPPGAGTGPSVDAILAAARKLTEGEFKELMWRVAIGDARDPSAR